MELSVLTSTESSQESSEEEEKEKDAPECTSETSTVEQFVPALICMRCYMPIAQYDEILPHRATDAWASQVYTYELDLFENKPPLWCYSATNPSTHRFDLVRCDAVIALRRHLLSFYGQWSAEHSFFVGHEWCCVACRACQNFLGWGFRRTLNVPRDTENETLETEEDAEVPVDNNLSFVGIILTRCVGNDKFPLSQFEACAAIGALLGPS
ncbi:hypothetical protein TCSYLVIO_006509 [Trypanosoma cruzi]|uniref:CULT domain-containing protein n=1 Tax=Trypanosoma cruzi Dm28c TaxID=1416333 RepID=V5BSP6_TRYCR|nr:hypothetical protein TCSYLVIO_006509 [Trypanosoma cruzi]ESS67558.1 hypothetical protein TCDM_14128 [Trypanosoma cruzi Dm28c]PBJ80540.1 hypothetical protein BCY84_01355 [Trypanosoma cruzi cruzi]RNF17310.1 hypothetical protein TcG_05855 [Trypanosoma cruzi]